MASMFAISDDQVLCRTTKEEEIIVDTVSGDLVSTFAVSSYQSIACYRNLYLLANLYCSIKLQQLGQSVPRWNLRLPRPQWGCADVLGCFSPKGQFIIVCSIFFGTCAYVLDVFSGNVRFILCDCRYVYDLKFISDEEFVILSDHNTQGARLQLFSVRSEDILGVLQVYSSFPSLHLTTCPGEGLLAIYGWFESDLEVIKVKLPERRNASRITKW